MKINNFISLNNIDNTDNNEKKCFDSIELYNLKKEAIKIFEENCKSIKMLDLSSICFKYPDFIKQDELLTNPKNILEKVVRSCSILEDYSNLIENSNMSSVNLFEFVKKLDSTILIFTKELMQKIFVDKYINNKIMQISNLKKEIINKEKLIEKKLNDIEIKRNKILKEKDNLLLSNKEVEILKEARVRIKNKSIELDKYIETLNNNYNSFEKAVENINQNNGFIINSIQTDKMLKLQKSVLSIFNILNENNSLNLVNSNIIKEISK